MRYPFHRYLRYLLLEGDDVDEIHEHIGNLGYIPPLKEDLQDMLGPMSAYQVVDDSVREEHGVLFFDEPCPSRDGMYRIVEEPRVRTLAEKLLLDKVPNRDVATILSHKFDGRFDIKAVNMFQSGFWDTVTLAPLDFYAYFQSGNRSMPMGGKAGTIDERGMLAAWREGVHPEDEELTIDKMMKSLTFDSYFQFKENQATPSPDKQEQARKWASVFMRAAGASKSLGIAGQKNKANEIKPILTYSEVNPPTLADLHRQHSETNLGTGSVIDEAVVEERK